MESLSFKRNRFPPDIIRQAVWLYYRFTLSFRDVEDLLAERGIDGTYETIRCWSDKFGPAIAAIIRKRRRRADCVWHLDEMIARLSGTALRSFILLARIARNLGNCRRIDLLRPSFSAPQKNFTNTIGEFKH